MIKTLRIFRRVFVVMMGSDSIQNLHGFAAAAGDFLTGLQGKHFPANRAVGLAVFWRNGLFHKISPEFP